MDWYIFAICMAHLMVVISTIASSLNKTLIVQAFGFNGGLQVMDRYEVGSCCPVWAHPEHMGSRYKSSLTSGVKAKEWVDT